MIDISDPRVIRLLESLGARYSWGGGQLADGLSRWPEGPWDCSGYAQAALLVLGLVDRAAWGDLRAHDLANACDPVLDGDEQLGDLAFYGAVPARDVEHVTVVLAPGLVIGANGGGKRTHGDDPLACVQVRPARYRKDFVTFGRLKQAYRPRGSR